MQTPRRAGRLDAVAELLRPDIADQVRRPVGVTVRVAVEAHDSAAGLCRATIVGQVELLLGKRRHQEPQPVELLRVQQAVEELVVIFDRDQFSVRDVAEIGPSRQINRRRELGQKVFGQYRTPGRTD